MATNKTSFYIKKENNMVQVITKEWEITKAYIFEVVLRDGLIKLDWHDFEMQAKKNKPAVAVKVDEPLDIAELIGKAIDGVRKNVHENLAGVMLIVSFKKGKDLMVEELGGMNDSISCLAEENVDIMWGIQQVEEITNNRCVTIFAFERS